jgi:hypothetical protein
LAVCEKFFAKSPSLGTFDEEVNKYQKNLDEVNNSLNRKTNILYFSSWMQWFV